MDALVTAHLPLVHYLAGQLARRLPPHITLDDLVSEGSFGLVQAAQRFDPTKHLKFSTFAWHRIEGAMRDYMRAESPMSRADRTAFEAGDLTRFRKVEQLDTHHDELIDRAPDPEQLALSHACGTHLRDRVRQLPPRERAIVIAYYWHDRGMKAIGHHHGVNESRISQLHARACRRLRMPTPPTPPTRGLRSSIPVPGRSANRDRLSDRSVA